MVYIVEKKSGNKVYLSLVEKVKEDGKYKDKYIKYLGLKENFTPAQLEDIKKSYNESKQKNTISSLRKNMKHVAFTGKVIELSEIRVFNKQRVRTALVDDGTGKCSVNLWNKYAELFEVGDTIKVINAFCKELKYVDESGREIKELRVTPGTWGMFMKPE